MNIIVDRAVIEQALEALDYVMRHGPAVQKAKDILQTALEQPEQEPVAWVYPEGLEALKSGKPWTAYGGDGSGPHSDGIKRIPLYTAPPQRKPLTDKEILTYRYMIDWTAEWSYINFARAIEAAHNIKD